MADTKLGILITGDNAQALKALKGVEHGLEGVDKKADQAKKSSIGFGDAMKGVALGAGIKFAIGEYEEAEVTARATAQAIKSTGNAAEISAAQQEKMVDSLSKVAAIDDEVIASGANMLRTFTNVKGEAFEPTLKAAADLSTVMGTDLNSSVIQVGKALNDPAKGLTKLTKIGVTFTDQQKEQVKALQESGDTMGAQKVILEELQKEFGGQAEAAATDSARMKVAFGNVAEEVGGVLAPALEQTAHFVGVLAEGFDKLPGPLKNVAVYGGIAALVGPRIVEGFSRIGDSVSQVKGWTSGIGKATDAAEGLEGASAGAAGGASKLGMAMGAIGAAGAAFAIYEASKAANQFKFDAEGAAKATDQSLGEFASTMSKIDPGVFKKIDLESLLRMRTLVDDNSGAAKALDGAIKEVSAGEKRASENHAEYGDKVAKITAADEKATDQLKELGDAFDGVSEAAGGVNDKLKAQADLVQAAEDRIKGLNDAATAAFDAQQGYADALAGVNDAEKTLEEARASGTQSEVEAKERSLSAAIVDQASQKLALAQADAEVEGKTLSAADAAVIQRDEMDKARETTGYWNADLQLLRDRLDAAAQASAGLAAQLAAVAIQQSITGIMSGFKDAFGGPKRTRAHGGDVRKGETVVVGDGGKAELFTAPADGRIHPDARAALAGAGSTQTINVIGVTDPGAVATIVASRLARASRLAGI